MNNSDELIIAPASARGTADRCIIRLSGPDVFRVVALFFHAEQEPIAEPEYSRILRGSLLLWPDEVVTLNIPCTLYYWPAGRGFTGQSSVELHMPGSPALVDAVIAAFLQTGQVRLAGPGEFTMRAFLAGRIDLTQAEAVLGIIDATDSHSLETACEQLAGRLASQLVTVRDNLFDTLCLLEAGFDFSEEDIDFISHDVLLQRLITAQEQLVNLCQQAADHTSASLAPRIVLFGPANSGKSSLWNALGAQFPPRNHEGEQPASALVSDTPGTTRDYLVRTIEVEGRTLTLVDTAGCEEESQATALSRTAMAKTTERLLHADLVLWCRSDNNGLFPKEERPRTQGKILYVRTKCDLFDSFEKENVQGDFVAESSKGLTTEQSPIMTSVKRGYGLTELAHCLNEVLSDNTPIEVVPSTAERCRESLFTAREGLSRAILLTEAHSDEVLIAAELRHAMNQLGIITGQVCTEDLLDRIFSQFCIGK